MGSVSLQAPENSSQKIMISIVDKLSETALKNTV